MKQEACRSMRYRCHQCMAVIQYVQIAHIDIYSDVCWIQCDVCELAFGPACGLDRKKNPNPHGYFMCPLRVPEVIDVRSNGRWVHVGRS